MQQLSHLAKFVLILAVGFSTAPAFAQSAGCACTTPYPAFGGSTGQLTTVSGQVLVSQPVGLTPAQTGAGLASGSQVLVGPNSSAIVVFGSCNLSVGPNSELTVIDTGADICLQVEGTGRQALRPDDSINPFVFGGIGIAGALGIAALASSGGDGGFALGGGTVPVSP